MKRKIKIIFILFGIILVILIFIRIIFGRLYFSLPYFPLREFYPFSISAYCLDGSISLGFMSYTAMSAL